MNEKDLQRQLQTRVRKKLEVLFTKYNMDYGGIDDSMKWKPLVLVIGNYSSGKSTLINELIGRDIQRTGQAPTDDSFTILTSGDGKEEREIPGSTLVNDSTLPFEHFKHYGEKLISHVTMKMLNVPVLDNLAIIDSPGMLDATSENDRGYNYMEVLGDFAKMADLIVLMFDPHKAGTIKESYEAIRNTLPEKSGEHRLIFVMSRIDECDHLTDFTRSYGTLCWNMSQMTGRKDIPHIYLTYAPHLVDTDKMAKDWPQEREELFDKIKGAAAFQINHILEDLDRQVNEVNIVAEAVTEFIRRATRVFWKYFNVTMLIAILLFFFGDVMVKSIIGMPEYTLLDSIRGGTVGSFPFTLIFFPLVFFFGTIAVGILSFSRYAFPKLRRKTLAQSSELLSLDTQYRKNLWEKMESKVTENIQKLTMKDLWSGYIRSSQRIKAFLNNDMKRFYDKIGSKRNSSSD